MKKFWFGMILLMAISLLPLPLYAEEEVKKDITEEVLTGPSELNPEKILGPGSIGIETYKDILMSFGATVRIIPTFEANWDFGMSDNTEGFFYTVPVKDYARTALDTGNSIQDIYSASVALNNAIENDRGDGSVKAAFDDFANAFYKADGTLISPSLATTIASLADGMKTIDTNADNAINGIAVPVATPIADAAAVAAASAAIQPGANLSTITAAAYTAANTTAGTVTAAFTDTQQKAIAGASATAASTAAAASAATSAASTAQIVYTAAIQAGADQVKAAAQAKAAAETAAKTSANNAAAAAASDAAQSAVIKAAVKTPMTSLGNRNFIQTSDALSAGFAQTVTKNPGATSVNLTDAVAYLNGLKAKVDGFKPYYLADSFLKTHSNESGSVNDGYIRTETKLHFNAMPKDKKWSFYAALEYDKPIDTNTVDNRGGKDGSSSNFGLERLNASIEFTPGLRLHGGWDVWGVDVIESASMVYGDDNPGFWLTGNYENTGFSLAWLKLEENDFQNDASQHRGVSDEDRDLLGGYFDLKFDKTDRNKMRFFYLYDRIRNVPSLDLTGALAARAGLGDYAGIYGNNGSGTASSPDTDAHVLGGYYLGKLGIFELMAEGAYKFGEAADTGLQGVYNGVNTIQYDDFDISSYAFAGDIGLELGETLGWQSFRFHLGAMYTSGDDDPEDDKLGGYSGPTNAQRFSRIWGGENTIIGDTNFALGTALYGYIPEFYGNGTPVFVGGLQNFTGTGGGRGDNPGLTMYSFGVTLRPRIFLIYHSNVNKFYWNEDFYVGNMVKPMQEINPATKSLEKRPYTEVKGGYVGTEWDNEITLALSKSMFIKAQASFFFPGDTVKAVTTALGAESDETASRLGFEFIWNF